MSTIWRARLAHVAVVVLGVVVLGLGAGSVVLDHLTRQPGTGGPVADAFIGAAGVVPATAVGMLLAARRPRNPIGWLLLAIIIVEIVPASRYLVLDYRMHHGSLPLGWLAVVLEECWPMFLVSVSLLLWLFPDGRLPTGRWHRAASAAAVGWLLLGVATSSRGVLVAAGGDVRIQASGSLANPSPVAFRVLDVLVIGGTLISWVTWLAVQVPTYRRASGVHRQQLKWLFSGAAI
jgi:two-component system NarL family sensor kinase